MDGRTLDEVVKALRSAVRALRAAEKALLHSPRDEAAPVRDSEIANEPPAPQVDPAEKALMDYLSAAAEHAKLFEEQDPQSFRAQFEPMKRDLHEAVLKGDMYQVGPAGAGMISFDNTPGTTLYEQCLRAMRANKLHAGDLVAPYVEQPQIKNWGDVDSDCDLVFMRYETPGTVTAHLNEGKLNQLMEAARRVPGAVDRCRSALTAQGVVWEVSDPRTGKLACEMQVSGVEGKWAACLDANQVLADVVGRLAVVEVDYDNNQEGWWDAARIDRSLPQQLLPIIRGKEKSIICHRSEIDKIEDWAATMPGWYEGTEEHPTPLVIRDAVTDDILN